MAKKRKKSGKYVVIGLGRFGFSVAEALLEAGETVLAIDKHENRVQEVADNLPRVVAASGADERALRALGVSESDTAIVSCGQSLEDSILTTAVLQAMGLEEIICKAVSAMHADILSRVGATRTIQPEREMATRLAESLVNPNVLEHLHLARDHSIIEVKAPKDMAGTTLANSDFRKNFGVNVIAVSRESADAKKSKGKGAKSRPMVEMPGPGYVFKRDDHLIILGRDEQIEAFRNHLEKKAGKD